MKYPTIDEVNKADRVQLAKWTRFLPSPETHDEIEIINRIGERFKQLGGMTPIISKKIGW